MRVTDKLLRVYRTDRQIAGLQSRLKSAERFLNSQTAQVQTVEQQRSDLEKQIKASRAVAADHEGEMKRLDEKIAALREQMNSARTNKEYKAFLTEVNTFKAERDRAESAALELMTKVDELTTRLGELDKQRGDRSKVAQVAAEDRDKRASEIKDRLAELKAERQRHAADVPPGVLKTYEELVRQRDEEAMASVEEQDRKRHEYTCGACMMAVPVEVISGLMSHGDLTRCRSCGCILYMEQATADALQPKGGKGKGGKGKKKESVS